MQPTSSDSSPELSLHFPDFAAWQKDVLRQTKACTQALAYWQNRWMLFHAGHISFSDLPFALPAPSVHTMRTDMVRHILDSSCSEKIRQFARQQSVTVYMLFFGHANNPASKAWVVIWGESRATRETCAVQFHRVAMTAEADAGRRWIRSTRGWNESIPGPRGAWKRACKKRSRSTSRGYRRCCGNAGLE
jgi:hypothetical protein